MIKGAKKKASKESKAFVKWVESRGASFDVAATFTFDEQPRSETHLESIIYKFKRDLYSSVFSKGRMKAEGKDFTKGLKVIVVKEGSVGFSSHIHMAIEIAPGYDYKSFVKELTAAWKKQSGAGVICDCQPYIDTGWLYYMSKEFGRGKPDRMTHNFFNI